DFPTIQGAIDAARDGDAILVAAGEYDSIDFRAKDVAVISEAGPESTTILGEAAFIRGESRAARLEGFRIQAGRGVYVSNASPTIIGNVLVQTQGIVGDGSTSALIVRNVVRDSGLIACYGDGDTEIRENVVVGAAGVGVSGQRHAVIVD